MIRTLTWRGRAARASRALVLLMMVTLVGGLSVSGAVNASAQTTDLSLYYPNTSLIGSYFLEGLGYRVPILRPYSVLWFEAPNASHFKQYNSGPGAPSSRCHWDQWQVTTQVLSYSETNHQCDSVNHIYYNSPIVYMPRNWNGSYWSRTGRSSVAYTNHGTLVCYGYIDWTGEVLGREVISTSPVVYAIHQRLTSATHWTWGFDPAGCAAGWTDHYQDNLLLVDQMPVAGSTTTAPGVRRSYGGNLTTYALTGIWDWDIWFDRWQRLPAHP